MRHGSLIAAGVLSATLFGPAWASAQAPANAAPGAARAPSAAAPLRAAATPASKGASWRYSRSNGHWWYWMPSNRWVFYYRDRWIPYDSKTYGQYYPTAADTPNPASIAPADSPYGPAQRAPGTTGIGEEGLTGKLQGGAGEAGISGEANGLENAGGGVGGRSGSGAGAGATTSGIGAHPAGPTTGIGGGGATNSNAGIGGGPAGSHASPGAGAGPSGAAGSSAAH